VLVWNTRYTTAARDHLAGAQPELVADDSALGRLAPVGHAHIDPLGRYRLDNPHGPPVGELRPLRHTDTDEHHARPTSPIGVGGDNTKRWISRR
jgi:hypothetical protein